MRPVESVERTALEGLHAFQPRQRRRREQPDCENDEPAGQLKAIVEPEPPQMIYLIEPGRFDLAVEPHVFAQVELVRDVVQIAQVIRLRRKPLLPVPLVEQLFRKGITVGVALGVEPRAGVAIPVPGSAEVRRGIQHKGIHPEIGQPLDLVNARHARAHDDDLVVRLDAVGHARPPRCCFLDDFGAVGVDYTELFSPCTCVRMPGWVAETGGSNIV